MSTNVVKNQKRARKVKTLKEKIEDILLSGDYVDYADVVRKADGGTIAYVQNIKRKMVAEGRLPAVDRRSKQSAPHPVAQSDSQTVKPEEMVDLKTPEHSKSRQNARRAAEMIMQGNHFHIVISSRYLNCSLSCTHG